LGRDKRVLSGVRTWSSATSRAPDDLGADRVELFKIVANHLKQRQDALTTHTDFQHVVFNTEALQLSRAVPVETPRHRRGVGIEGRHARSIVGSIFGNVSCAPSVRPGDGEAGLLNLPG
jgi:hypothetical protein